MAISDEHRSLISKLQPVGLPEIPCAECEPTVDGLKIEHAALCPVMISIDTAMDRDREWFERHPFADRYYRPVMWGEAVDLATKTHVGQRLSTIATFSVEGRVRVERLEDGVRLRRFDDVYFVVDGLDSVSD